MKAGGEGTTEDEMFGWHYLLIEHEFEKALGVGDGQGGQQAAVHGVANSRDMTEQLSMELIPRGLRSRSLWASYS